MAQYISHYLQYCTKYTIVQSTCGLAMPYGGIDMDQNYGLLPDSTKPLPEPMLTKISDRWVSARKT